MSEHLSRLERQLYQQVKATVTRYGLLADGDRVLVALSGGKDSYVMAHLLSKLAARLPFEVSLVAVHLDQRQPGYDGAPLRRWLEQSGLAFEILSEDTYGVVTSHLDDTETYCALCSRLRRGILYSAAERLGCNKLALGHHADDTLETFLLNLFYSGKLQAMPALYTTDDGQFQVIRVLIESRERDIAELARQLAFPIIPCNLCGSQSGLRRDRMTELLDQLERESPHLRAVMLNALRNVSPTHLLDRDLLAAWQARPAEVRPAEHVPRKAAHATALPVVEGRLAPHGGVAGGGTAEAASTSAVPPARRLPLLPSAPPRDSAG